MIINAQHPGLKRIQEPSTSRTRAEHILEHLKLKRARQEAEARDEEEEEEDQVDPK